MSTVSIKTSFRSLETYLQLCRLVSEAGWSRSSTVFPGVRRLSSALDNACGSLQRCPQPLYNFRWICSQLIFDKIIWSKFVQRTLNRGTRAAVCFNRFCFVASSNHKCVLQKLSKLTTKVIIHIILYEIYVTEKVIKSKLMIVILKERKDFCARVLVQNSLNELKSLGGKCCNANNFKIVYFCFRFRLLYIFVCMHFFFDATITWWIKIVRFHAVASRPFKTVELDKTQRLHTVLTW